MMGTWFKRDESMDLARKWMSVGAGAASFIVLAYMFNIGRIVADGGLSALLPMLLALALVLVLVLAGVESVCELGPKSMNGFPPPLLVFLGFTLGVLIVIVGAIYIGLKIVAEIFSAF